MTFTDRDNNNIRFDWTLTPVFLFKKLYHPQAERYLITANSNGVKAVIGSLGHQVSKKDSIFFSDRYEPVLHPNPAALPPIYPCDNTDFDQDESFSVYNWELFYHIPILIAEKLRAEFKFEEAEHWYRFIFDPYNKNLKGAPDQPWRVRPFFENNLTRVESRPMQEFMLLLNQGDSTLAKQVARWEKDPFNPHMIARMRIIAYQKYVVMNYLESLVEWADSLFQRDTIESINEAVQLYINAKNILGERPQEIHSATQPPIRTYETIRDDLGPFNNALLELDELISANHTSGGSQVLTSSMLYFCVPHNPKLVELWSTIEDRLYKIRNCMNIKGKLRQLPLFQPPIDPELLIRAKQQGIDFNKVLDQLAQPNPIYRFNIILSKSIELASEVKALGALLLSVLEKKDSEELNVQLQSQSLKTNELIKLTANAEIEVANGRITSLEEQKSVVRKRQSYYQNKQRIYQDETESLELIDEIKSASRKSSELHQSAAVFNMIPSFSLSLMTGDISLSLGGSILAASETSEAIYESGKADFSRYNKETISVNANYNRRFEEWNYQADIAELELDQLDNQIEVAKLELAVSESNLVRIEKDIENSKVNEQFWKRKVTNKEFYSWMLSQLSGVYYQSYKLAFDYAKKAETAMRYELGISDSSHIKFGYWDGVKKGLLSGDRLLKDIRLMESHYLENNKREQEITINLSLSQLFPEELIRLKDTGECEIRIPEDFFDIAYPGQYRRRIKTVGLSIPCVTGPYINVNCVLTQTASRIRVKYNAKDDDYDYNGVEDDRFRHRFSASESITTSQAVGDSGLFETNLRDERYLPFEGTGAISDWHLKLPETFKAFDYNTISDAILHIGYTCLDGGQALRDQVVESLKDKVKSAILGQDSRLSQLLDVKREFVNEWHKFHDLDENDNHVLTLNIRKNNFPYLFSEGELTLDKSEMFLQVVEKEEVFPEIEILMDTPVEAPLLMNKSSLPFKKGSLFFASVRFDNSIALDDNQVSEWTLKISKEKIAGLPSEYLEVFNIDGNEKRRIKPDVLDNMWIVIRYAVDFK